MSDVVLKFISGPLQGTEFTLENGHEVVLGRSDQATLRIADETVSRKHARIFFRNDEIVIEDLSKNGTYVNSQPIKLAVLLPGDLVYIGHSVLKISTRQPAVVAPRRPTVTAKPALLPLGVGSGPTTPSSTERTVMSGFDSAPVKPTPPSTRPPSRPAGVGTSTGEHFRGSIGDIALTDLLQLLTSSRKTGMLVLHSADMLGKIYIEKGSIHYATVDEVDSPAPQKVLYRLLRWTSGTFEFTPRDRETFPLKIDETTDHLLLEAMHQLDEINNLGPDLPSLHAEVAVAENLPVPLKDLPSGDLDFIQLVMQYKLVRDILDQYGGTDFEAYTYLKSLLGRGFLRITD